MPAARAAVQHRGGPLRHPRQPRGLHPKTALPKQTVSFILSGLERQGYIRRHQNERDHRNKSVQITPAGEAALYPVLDSLSAAEEQAYCLLSEEQRQAITEGHQLLLRAMRQAMAGEGPSGSR